MFFSVIISCNTVKSCKKQRYMYSHTRDERGVRRLSQYSGSQ